jgi:predicted CoA-binding protein
MPPMAPSDLDELLADVRTVAVVGCSPRTGRPANYVPRYLQSQGLRIIPVNPHCDEMMGEKCYPDLASIPSDITLDVVDVFRRPEFVPGVAREVADRAALTGERPLFFTQVGVHHPEAQRIIQEAGLPYVADRCLMVDYRTRT